MRACQRLWTRFEAPLSTLLRRSVRPLGSVCRRRIRPSALRYCVRCWFIATLICYPLHDVLGGSSSCAHFFLSDSKAPLSCQRWAGRKTCRHELAVAGVSDGSDVHAPLALVRRRRAACEGDASKENQAPLDVRGSVRMRVLLELSWKPCSFGVSSWTSRRGYRGINLGSRDTLHDDVVGARLYTNLCILTAAYN